MTVFLQPIATSAFRLAQIHPPTHSPTGSPARFSATSSPGHSVRFSGPNKPGNTDWLQITKDNVGTIEGIRHRPGFRLTRMSDTFTPQEPVEIDFEISIPKGEHVELNVPARFPQALVVYGRLTSSKPIKACTMLVTGNVSAPSMRVDRFISGNFTLSQGGSINAKKPALGFQVVDGATVNGIPLPHSNKTLASIRPHGNELHLTFANGRTKTLKRTFH